MLRATLAISLYGDNPSDLLKKAITVADVLVLFFAVVKCGCFINQVTKLN